MKSGSWKSSRTVHGRPQSEPARPGDRCASAAIARSTRSAASGRGGHEDVSPIVAWAVVDEHVHALVLLDLEPRRKRLEPARRRSALARNEEAIARFAGPRPRRSGRTNGRNADRRRRRESSSAVAPFPNVDRSPPPSERLSAPLQLADPSVPVEGIGGSTNFGSGHPALRVWRWKNCTTKLRASAGGVGRRDRCTRRARVRAGRSPCAQTAWSPRPGSTPSLRSAIGIARF